MQAHHHSWVQRLYFSLLDLARGRHKPAGAPYIAVLTKIRTYPSRKCFSVGRVCQPPPIKKRQKHLGTKNRFVACAARSPLDLGGRESPKTRGSLHFFVFRCGCIVCIAGKRSSNTVDLAEKRDRVIAGARSKTKYRAALPCATTLWRSNRCFWR